MSQKRSGLRSVLEWIGKKRDPSVSMGDFLRYGSGQRDLLDSAQTELEKLYLTYYPRNFFWDQAVSLTPELANLTMQYIPKTVPKRDYALFRIASALSAAHHDAFDQATEKARKTNDIRSLEYELGLAADYASKGLFPRGYGTSLPGTILGNLIHYVERAKPEDSDEVVENLLEYFPEQPGIRRRWVNTLREAFYLMNRGYGMESRAKSYQDMDSKEQEVHTLLANMSSDYSKKIFDKYFESVGDEDGWGFDAMGWRAPKEEFKTEHFSWLKKLGAEWPGDNKWYLDRYNAAHDDEGRNDWGGETMTETGKSIIPDPELIRSYQETSPAGVKIAAGMVDTLRGFGSRRVRFQDISKSLYDKTTREDSPDEVIVPGERADQKSIQEQAEELQRPRVEEASLTSTALLSSPPPPPPKVAPPIVTPSFSTRPTSGTTTRDTTRTGDLDTQDTGFSGPDGPLPSDSFITHEGDTTNPESTFQPTSEQTETTTEPTTILPEGTSVDELVAAGMDALGIGVDERTATDRLEQGQPVAVPVAIGEQDQFRPDGGRNQANLVVDRPGADVAIAPSDYSGAIQRTVTESVRSAVKGSWRQNGTSGFDEKVRKKAERALQGALPAVQGVGVSNGLVVMEGEGAPSSSMLMVPDGTDNGRAVRKFAGPRGLFPIAEIDNDSGFLRMRGGDLYGGYGSAKEWANNFSQIPGEFIRSVVPDFWEAAARGDNMTLRRRTVWNAYDPRGFLRGEIERRVHRMFESGNESARRLASVLAEELRGGEGAFQRSLPIAPEAKDLWMNTSMIVPDRPASSPEPPTAAPVQLAKRDQSAKSLYTEGRLRRLEGGNREQSAPAYLQRSLAYAGQDDIPVEAPNAELGPVWGPYAYRSRTSTPPPPSLFAGSRFADVNVEEGTPDEANFEGIQNGRRVIHLNMDKKLSTEEFRELSKMFLRQGYGLVTKDAYERLVSDKQGEDHKVRLTINDLRGLAHRRPPASDETFNTEAEKAYEYRQGYLGAVQDNVHQRNMFKSQVEELRSLYVQRKTMEDYRTELEDAMNEYDVLEKSAVAPQSLNDYRRRVLNMVARVSGRATFTTDSADESQSIAESIDRARHTPHEFRKVYRETLGLVESRISDLTTKISQLEGELRVKGSTWASQEAITDAKLQSYAQQLGVPYEPASSIPDLSANYRIPDFVRSVEESVKEPTQKERRDFLRDKVTASVLTEFGKTMKDVQTALLEQQKLTKALSEKIREPFTKRLPGGSLLYQPVPVYQPMQRMYHRFQEVPYGPTYGYPKGRDFSGIVAPDQEGITRHYRSKSRLKKGSKGARLRRGVLVSGK